MKGEIYHYSPGYLSSAFVKFDYPEHWERGTLLDHKLFANGKSRCILLGESPEAEGVSFNSREDAQCFISWWYAPASAKMMEREFDCSPRPPDDL